MLCDPFLLAKPLLIRLHPVEKRKRDDEDEVEVILDKAPPSTPTTPSQLIIAEVARYAHNLDSVVDVEDQGGRSSQALCTGSQKYYVPVVSMPR